MVIVGNIRLQVESSASHLSGWVMGIRDRAQPEENICPHQDPARLKTATANEKGPKPKAQLNSGNQKKRFKRQHEVFI